MVKFQSRRCPPFARAYFHFLIGLFLLKRWIEECGNRALEARRENLSKALMNERFHSSHKADAPSRLAAPGRFVAWSLPQYDRFFQDLLSSVTR